MAIELLLLAFNDSRDVVLRQIVESAGGRINWIRKAESNKIRIFRDEIAARLDLLGEPGMYWRKRAEELVECLSVER